MRKRNVEVLFRMSVEEFDKFKDMVKIAGVTKQKYLLDLVFNSNNQLVHRDEEKALKTITNKMNYQKIGVTRLIKSDYSLYFLYKCMWC